MIKYITRSRNVGGLEINYTEYQVLLVDDAQFSMSSSGEKVIEMVGTFTHERCAEGLRDQLNDALQHGLNYSRNEEWGEMITAAHQSLDRLQAIGQRRLAESFDPDADIDPALSASDMEIDDRPHKCLEGLEDEPFPCAIPRTKPKRSLPTPWGQHNPPGDPNKI